MNQNAAIMNIYEFCEKDSMPHGNQVGRKVFSKMRDYVEQHKANYVFEISFAKIEFADSSFARESLILLANLYRGKKGFYISNLTDLDVIDNLDYAALALEQPLILKLKDEIRMLGPQLNKLNLEIFNIVQTKKKVTTSHVATMLDLSVPNASSKLKKLVDEGYILRFEETAESGGIEFVYQSIC